MHLHCDFHLARPLFDAEPLSAFHELLKEYLPGWSRSLRISAGDKIAILGTDGDLHGGIHSVAPPRRGVGSAILLGGDEGLSIYLDHTHAPALADGNQISFEILDCPSVEGRAVASWIRDFFEAASGRLPVRYGKAHSNEEYYAKNMHNDESGTGALKAGCNDGLPGLYWLNFIGPEYCNLIGRERLLRAPAAEVKAVGEGVLLGLDPSPRAWTTVPYQKQEQAVIDHLGKQFFFSRQDPDRQTVGPDFFALVKKRVND